LTVGILLILYQHFFTYLAAHIVNMLGVMEESQENTESMRRSTWKVLVATKKITTPRQRTSNYCN